MIQYRKDAIHRVSTITANKITAILLIGIAIIGLTAQSLEYKDLVILKDGTVINGVQTKVTKDSLVVTKPDGTETAYIKSEVLEVKKKAFDVSKGFKDLVILKDGTLWNATQTLVTKDSLIVTRETGETIVYQKTEIAEVKKGVFDKTKGFKDTVTLNNGTVIEPAQTLVNRDSLIVFTEDGTANIYPKKEVSGVIKGKAEVAAKLGPAFTSKIGIELVPILAGEFVMGCSIGDSECDDIEKPAHKVKVTKGFYIGKYEVTQGQWKAVMGNNPSGFKDCGDNCPVENVSWNDIKEFLVKLNVQEGRTGARMFRLPAEAEWEYAARGGTTTKYYWGNELGSGFLGIGAVGTDYLWYRDNSGLKTHPVGQKKPNAFGLYDMIGNVWEWTNDNYGGGGYLNRSKTDNTVDSIISRESEYKVFRGGSSGNVSRGMRSSFRGNGSPSGRYDLVGFRLLLSVD